MMNVYWLAILSTLLVACGSGMRTSSESVDKAMNAYTKGTNEIGQRYTRFSSDDSMEKIQGAIEQDATAVPKAMLLAGNITFARFLTHTRNEADPQKYEVEIKWSNRPTPQLFRGTPNIRNNVLAAVLRPVNDGENLTLDLTCFKIEEFTCGKALVVMFEGSRNVGGIEFVRQPKVLQTVASPTFNSSTLSPKAKNFFDAHKAGEPVIARSFSVVYGASEVEVVGKTPQGLKMIFKADLIDPEGDALPVTGVGEELRTLGQTTIVGNNTRSLTILQEDKAAPTPARPPTGNTVIGAKREFVMRLTDPVSKPVGPPAPGNSICQVADKKPASTLAKSIVDEIISYCDQEHMAEHRTYWSKRSPGTIRRLMNTYSEMLGGPKTEVAKRMKTAIDELRITEMPIAALGITIQESGGFNPWAVSPVGATSEWQIMPCTGFDLGIVHIQGTRCTKQSVITFDGRKDSKLATQAMANYMKQFFRKWNYRDPTTNQIRQNYPMALASYKNGPGSTDKASDKAVDKIKKGRSGRVLSYGRLTEEQIRLISSDFFYLAKENVGLTHSQIEYTFRIIAGTQIILDPKSHGMPELGPVEGN